MADNLNKTVEFRVDGFTLARRLIARAATTKDELNVASPVGQALRRLVAGEERAVDTPSGKITVSLIRVVESA